MVIQTVRFKCAVINYNTIPYLRLNVWLCIIFGPMNVNEKTISVIIFFMIR